MNVNATFAGVEPGGLAVLALVVVPGRPLGGEDVERGQPLPPHRPPERAQRQPQRHPQTPPLANKPTAVPAASWRQLRGENSARRRGDRRGRREDEEEGAVPDQRRGEEAAAATAAVL